MDKSESLKSMLNNLINDKSRDAELDFHSFVTEKMKNIVETTTVTSKKDLYGKYVRVIRGEFKDIVGQVRGDLSSKEDQNTVVIYYEDDYPATAKYCTVNINDIKLDAALSKMNEEITIDKYVKVVSGPNKGVSGYVNKVFKSNGKTTSVEIENEDDDKEKYFNVDIEDVKVITEAAQPKQINDTEEMKEYLSDLGSAADMWMGETQLNQLKDIFNKGGKIKSVNIDPNPRGKDMDKDERRDAFDAKCEKFENRGWKMFTTEWDGDDETAEVIFTK